MTRQDANIIIAKELVKICENPKNKDQRFWQLLANLGIIQIKSDTNGDSYVHDSWNEESVDTLIKLLKKESNI